MVERLEGRVVFSPPEAISTKVIIGKTDVHDNITTLEDIKKVYQNSTFKDFKITNYSLIDQPAIRMDGNYSQAFTEGRLTDITTILNENIYSFTVYSDQDEYKKYAPLFQKMYDTFQIISISNNQSLDTTHK